MAISKLAQPVNIITSISGRCSLDPPQGVNPINSGHFHIKNYHIYIVFVLKDIEGLRTAEAPKGP